MMLAIPDILTPDEARMFRLELEQTAWSDGRASAGALAGRVKDNQQLADDNPLAARLGGLILERLARSERFMQAALPLKVLPPRFNRYVGGGAYGDHVDSAVLSVPGAPLRLRGDLSATVFFSDPEDYDGGELVIDSGLGETRVKLPAGHMVLYSARTVHRVTPVTRGARFAAFFWIESMVRQGDRRAMLLDLDEAIGSLRADTPDHPAVLRLTGLYHNLLREWADT
ncbi:Fe2+-dependent dioxygenase [Phenylobacterium sp.]|uniref:Fe2+-dependent dioxygenase n=1 Tax=Phenylobacterium sp. TaxID=1871053 RepID=UPI00289B5AE7|nr:Fe2+-dependent dioxygenase [Phenylobacterium sp.]